MIFITAKFQVRPEHADRLARDQPVLHRGDPRRARLPVVRLVPQPRRPVASTSWWRPSPTTPPARPTCSPTTSRRPADAAAAPGRDPAHRQHHGPRGRTGPSSARWPSRRGSPEDSGPCDPPGGPQGPLSLSPVCLPHEEPAGRRPRGGPDRRSRARVQDMRVALMVDLRQRRDVPRDGQGGRHAAAPARGRRRLPRRRRPAARSRWSTPATSTRRCPWCAPSSTPSRGTTRS